MTDRPESADGEGLQTSTIEAKTLVESTNEEEAIESNTLEAPVEENSDKKPFDAKARGAELRAALLKAAHRKAEGESQAKETDNTSASKEPEKADHIKPRVEAEVLAEYVVFDNEGDEEPADEAEMSKESEVEIPSTETSSEAGATNDEQPQAEDETVTLPEHETEAAGIVDCVPEAEAVPKDALDAKGDIKDFANPPADDAPVQENLNEEQEPETEPRHEPQEDETVNEAKAGDASPKTKETPAPEPIIEEVTAAVVEHPVEEPTDQIAVAPKKLGFFKRLKLLILGRL